jgi:TRAP transporter TAXI family solute receptor
MLFIPFVKAVSKLILTSVLLFCILLPSVKAEQSSQVYPSVYPVRLSLKIASGNTAGAYYAIADKICNNFNDKHNQNQLKCINLISKGPVRNLSLLANAKVDIAIVKSLEFSKIFNQDAVNLYSKIKPIAIIGEEHLTILAKKSSKIKTIYDLSGKLINIGMPKAHNTQITTVILKAFKIKPREVFNIDLDSAVQALCKSKELDAWIYFLPHPNSQIYDNLRKCGLTLVPLSTEDAVKISQKIKFLRPSKIPQNTYLDFSDDLQSISLQLILAAKANIDPEAFKYFKNITSNSLKK